MKTLLLVILTFLGQRLLGHPGAPAGATDLWLPLIWVVWPPLKTDRSWPFWGLVALGLAWDLAMEPIIGPGGIAWSAAGFAVVAMARRVADRSPIAWGAAGALAAAVVLLIRHLALMPLGLARPWLWLPAIRTIAMAAIYCALVVALTSLDVKGFWHRVQRRRLR